MTPANKENQKKEILIVEDDEFLVKAYQVKFAQEGVNVLVAYDGKQAVNFLVKKPSSLVLLDLMLPVINGFDVLAEIRKNENWKNVPVVVLSNLGQAEDVKRANALGANDYVIKANVKISDIVAIAKKYL